MNLRKKYRQLFKGKLRSSDSALLIEGNIEPSKAAKKYLPIVKSSAKLKRAGLINVGLFLDKEHDLLGLKMAFNKWVDYLDIFDDIIPEEDRSNEVRGDWDYDKEVHVIHITFERYGDDKELSSSLEDIDWDYNKEGKTIKITKKLDRGNGNAEAEGTVEINGVEYKWDWTKETESGGEASFSNVTIDPDGEALSAMDEVSDVLYDAIHTAVVEELGLEESEIREKTTLVEQYKRLFKGRTSSNDAKLLNENVRNIKPVDRREPSDNDSGYEGEISYYGTYDGIPFEATKEYLPDGSIFTNVINRDDDSNFEDRDDDAYDEVIDAINDFDEKKSISRKNINPKSAAAYSQVYALVDKYGDSVLELMGDIVDKAGLEKALQIHLADRKLPSSLDKKLADVLIDVAQEAPEVL